MFHVSWAPVSDVGIPLSTLSCPVWSKLRKGFCIECPLVEKQCIPRQCVRLLAAPFHRYFSHGGASAVAEAKWMRYQNKAIAKLALD